MMSSVNTIKLSNGDTAIMSGMFLFKFMYTMVYSKSMP
jgi:hypothetical protein